MRCLICHLWATEVTRIVCTRFISGYRHVVDKQRISYLKVNTSKSPEGLLLHLNYEFKAKIILCESQLLQQAVNNITLSGASVFKATLQRA